MSAQNSSMGTISNESEVLKSRGRPACVAACRPPRQAFQSYKERAEAELDCYASVSSPAAASACPAT
ncbi:MAG: hypothetical protein H6740_11385 [Alphaproteobacteria bacterium]|nr:hypothetical protein [Alphaproteobacteria bacterium]